MKNLSLFILLIAATFTSCSSDDDAPQQETPVITNDDLITGTWELTARKQLGVDITLDNCETTSTIQFNTNKTYTEKTFVEIPDTCVSDGEFSGSWSISEDVLTLMFDEFGTATTNTPKFNIANDELTLTFDEIEDTYIKK